MDWCCCPGTADMPRDISPTWKKCWFWSVEGTQNEVRPLATPSVGAGDGCVLRQMSSGRQIHGRILVAWQQTRSNGPGSETMGGQAQLHRVGVSGIPARQALARAVWSLDFQTEVEGAQLVKGPWPGTCCRCPPNRVLAMRRGGCGRIACVLDRQLWKRVPECLSACICQARLD